MRTLCIIAILSCSLLNGACSRDSRIHKVLITPDFTGTVSCQKSQWQSLTNAIFRMEEQLTDYIADQPVDEKHAILPDLPDYIRFYIAQSNNNMLVFFASPSDARLVDGRIEGIMYADGGGSDFFQVEYNMQSNCITLFNVNCPE
jgi:hypothetical protein